MSITKHIFRIKFPPVAGLDCQSLRDTIENNLFLFSFYRVGKSCFAQQKEVLILTNSSTRGNYEKKGKFMMLEKQK